LQRENAAKKKLQAIMATGKPIFYDPNILTGDGSPGMCSVCSNITYTSFNRFAFVAMCSKECADKLQWNQFGMNPTKGEDIIYDGQKLKFCTWRLKKNSAGEPCVIAYDPELEDEYNTAPEILIPVSEMQRIKQL
jgi:hypothetical protein